MANQHTSELVGVERPWADAVAAGLGDKVAKKLSTHVTPARLRTIMAWLERGAPYQYATHTSISQWRRVLADAGAPPKVPSPNGGRTREGSKVGKPPIMYLESENATAAASRAA
jgi:hypothetical protein